MAVLTRSTLSFLQSNSSRLGWLARRLGVGDDAKIAAERTMQVKRCDVLCWAGLCWGVLCWAELWCAGLDRAVLELGCVGLG